MFGRVLKRETSFSNNSLTLDDSSVISCDVLKIYLRVQPTKQSIFQRLEHFVSSAIKCLFVKFFVFFSGKMCFYLQYSTSKSED